MSLFIDQRHRRKSPMAVAAFFAALADLCVFAVLYSLLAEPLYRSVTVGGAYGSTLVQGLIIALSGTALCCLQFLLRDKRIAPYGFAGLAVALAMFYAGALLLDREVRGMILQVITLFGLLPVLVGNAVTWSVFAALRRRDPHLIPRRRTLREELRAEGAAVKGTPLQTEDPVRQPAEQVGQPASPFGPEGAGGPMSGRTDQEEAMLLYMDTEEDDNETSNN